MRTLMVVDMSNLLYKAFYAREYIRRNAVFDERMEVEDDNNDTAGLAHHSALTTLNKYFKKYNPDKVIAVFDRPSWRKGYTDSEECISQKPYKGHRRQKMSPSEKEQYQDFMEHIKEFEEILRTHTSVVCLAGDQLEADDLIAGMIQTYKDDNHIIISSDKDLMQLLRYPNVQLIDPTTGNARNLEEWDNNADYFLFVKCIRGDTSDNVQSAYPRVRETKLKEAFNDQYKYVNLMNVTWQNQEERQFVVKNLYEENTLLMDLTKQPDHIKQKMSETIEEGMNAKKKFNYFNFLRFCGKYSLKKISGNLEQYVMMLSK